MRKLRRRCWIITMWALAIAMNITIAERSAPAGEWVHMIRQAPDQRIVSILPMPGGGLWASTNGEFYRYDGTTWRILDGVKDAFQYPAPFLSDENGNVYLLDGERLAVLSGETVRWFKSAGARAPVTGTIGSDGVLYFTSNNLSGRGIYAFDGETVTRIHDARSVSIAADNEGRIWATVRAPDSEQMKLICRENGEWSDRTGEVSASLSPFDYTGNTGVTVSVAPDGAVWVNNRGMYGILRDDVWTFGGGGGTPYFIDFDSSGRVWGYGETVLYLLNDAGKWDISRQMTVGPAVTAVFLVETDKGEVWITDNENLYRYAGGLWRLVESPNDLASDRITTMAFTDNGELLCGHAIRRELPSSNYGLSIWDGTEWFNTNKFGKRTVNNIYHLETTPDGTVLAYTDMGYFEYYNQTWTSLDSLSVLSGTRIIETDMEWENWNTLWLTTDKGLVKYNYDQSPKLIIYLPPNPDGDPEPGELYSVTIGDHDIVYCQNITRSILSFDETSKTWENVVDYDTRTYDFEIDEEGAIWGAREDGLAYWNVSDLAWDVVTSLNEARKIDIDPDGRIWVSGYGETGYFSDDSWHSIPGLNGQRAADFAFSESGEVAVNTIDVGGEDAYTGLYVYMETTGVTDAAPEPAALEAVNVPNPFNPSTSIRFRMPASGFAEVTVYAATGQKVRTFGSSWYPAGWNSIIWNARADDGVPCSSGVYFYRIAAGETATAGKMLLLR